MSKVFTRRVLRQMRRDQFKCRQDEYECNPQHTVEHFRRRGWGWPVQVCAACLPNILRHLDDRFFVVLQWDHYLPFERFLIHKRTYRDKHTSSWLTPYELGIREYLRLDAL